MDAPNLCEKHSVSNNSYNIEWHEPTKEEILSFFIQYMLKK